MTSVALHIILQKEEEITMQNKKVQIGGCIREKVIPVGMTVTEAAKILGVSRPALSNLLNGKAALSHEMALRLSKAFSFPHEEL
ncbi:MAG: HigA family addiction module antitoxin, partial [Candidatus Adiutrix sp.]